MKKAICLFNTKGLLFIFLLGFVISCTDDFNITPRDDDEFTAEKYYQDPLAYRKFLAKIYGGLAKAGNGDGDGATDIGGIRADFSPYIRAFFTVQELPTDEAVIAWQDGNLPSINTHTWEPNNEFIYAMYSRTFFQIGLANEFLRQSSPSQVDSRPVDPAVKAEMASYRAEVKFLRALSYWHALDLFGSVPIVTESDPVGFFFPKQNTKEEVFTFIVNQLKEIDVDLKESRTNEYGRVDKIAAKMLLAKMYLNAKVYIGQDKDAEAAAALAPVLASNYKIATVSYKNLFMADNDKNGAQEEFIFPIRYDGLYTTTSGGTSYLVHAAILSSQTASDFGVNGGWKGLRARREFVGIFDTTDKRAMFHSTGQTLDIASISDETQGYAVTKWTNKKSDGTSGSDGSGTNVDTDFPMFRLADAYLMYAELAVKGQGSKTTAKDYVNKLRTRATAPQILESDLSLDFVLKERSRELFWECQRRTDLIRFGKFSGSSYLWQWKGNAQNGTSIDSHLDVFPIPASSMSANPNLKQNIGYNK